MQLHTPTLLVTLLLGFALLTLELGVAQRGLRARPELRRWNLGNWAMLAGFAMLFARVLMPEWLSLVLGNGLIALGLIAYVQALHRLLREAAPPRWTRRIQPALWLGLALLVFWPQSLRTAAVSLLFAGLLAPAVWLVLRHGWRDERSLRTVGVTLGLAMLALGVRAVHALGVPEDYQSVMQPSLGQGATFMMAFLALLGSGFAFQLAVFERVAQQMEHLASHDGLTGCLNRSTTDALLAHELRRARRERQAGGPAGRPLAFVLLDLDHFKQVNDRHGHRTGDAVLQAFVAIAKQRLRGSDALGRTGGEEFGLVLPGTDADGARVLLESIRQAVAAAPLATDESGRPVQVTVSAGIAVAPGDAGISADRLYGRADQALYEAKHGGRNRVEVYGDSNPVQAALPLNT
ncbi:GGDEF domain-containing protein [Ideonella sp. DXS22W]|uniref:diguanylate cyclase n=1 Tax=Pseudaquabacterium inlustre TaxID=2984192 RepID=A0ABU9CA57_9BURK